MSNRIVKSLTMLALVVGLTLAAAVVSANGQSSQLVTANIPFDFIVADRTLPAGKYTARAATSDGQGLTISQRDGESVMILSNMVAAKGEKPARLVFHRYGQQYFLAEVWSGESYGRHLRQCKRERNLRRELATYASKSGSGYEVVEVVAMVR